jgi:hypothetical protein
MKGDRIKLAERKEIRSRLRHEKDEKVKLKLIFSNAIANISMDLESASPKINPSDGKLLIFWRE